MLDNWLFCSNFLSKTYGNRLQDRNKKYSPTFIKIISWFKWLFLWMSALLLFQTNQKLPIIELFTHINHVCYLISAF